MNYVFTSTIKIQFTNWKPEYMWLQMESVPSLDREGGKNIIYFPMSK